MNHVCLESMASDRCISRGFEFKTLLGRQSFSAYQVISVCVCVLSMLYLLGKQGSMSIGY